MFRLKIDCGILAKRRGKVSVQMPNCATLSKFEIDQNAYTEHTMGVQRSDYLIID